MFISVEEPVSRLEAINEEIHRELGQIHAQLNTITAIMFGNVAVTILTAVGIVGAVLITQ